MSIPKAAYPWQESYVDALGETDESLLSLRLHEALAAIEQRRLSPVTDPNEQRALANAQAGIQALMTDPIYAAAAFYKAFLISLRQNIYNPRL
jgi:hypothetical protein